MSRRSLEEYQELYAQALHARNWNDVVVWSTELLRIDPAQPGVWGNRGIGLMNLGHPLDAVLNHQRALDYDEAAGHYSNLGAAYHAMDKTTEALEVFAKSIELDPNIAQVYMNTGHIHKWERRWEEALKFYHKTVECDPDYVDGRLSRAFMMLKSGRLAEGWKEYEWRWKSDQLPPRGLKLPVWNGEDNLNGKSILIYSEQGLGDIIQFARYARVLRGRYPDTKILIECKTQVKRLLQTIPEVDQVLNFGEKIPKVDYIVAMLTLPAYFSPTLATIPALEREYIIKPADIEFWKNKFDTIPAPHNKKIKVGICWAGMARMNNALALKVDEMRSLELSDMADLVSIPDVIWISLQKGPPAEQLKRPPKDMYVADFTEDMYDFYETCCAIENCDLVISVDTAVCHAAASIGKETWMLGRWDGCWRWFCDREDSPWYPTLRVFEQTAPYDWKNILLKVEQELRKFVNAKRQT